MPESFGLGWVLLWGGVIFAYLGVILLPLAARRRPLAWKIFAICLATGWVGMLVSAFAVNYEQAREGFSTYLSALIFFGIVSPVIGACLVFNISKEGG